MGFIVLDLIKKVANLQEGNFLEEFMMSSIKYLLCVLAASIFFLPASSQAACNPSTQFCNVQVLIEQYSPPQQVLDFNLKVFPKFPDLTQLHLRVWGDLNVNQGGGSPQVIAQQINYMKLPKGVKLAFHPDNSKGSGTTWNACFPYQYNTQCTQTCAKNDGACIFQASIQFMNEVNKFLAQQNPPKKFTIFSIEQSYLETSPLAADGGSTPAAQLLNATTNQKKCLTGQALANNPWCPNRTVTVPQPVQYAEVGPSCMAANLFGPTVFDYGYPQMYNLYPNYTPSTNSNRIYPLPRQYVPSPFPPSGSTPPYQVWDANLTPSNPPNPPVSIIPSFLNLSKTSKGYSIYAPPLGVSITTPLISQILANIITTKYSLNSVASTYPCVNTTTTPATAYPTPIYFTITGETYMWGNTSMFPKIASINSTLGWIYNNVNSMRVTGSPNIPQWPLAIWSFDTMLVINPPSHRR